MYRSRNDELAANHDIGLAQHGILTKERMVALLEPGAVDPNEINGKRVRWAYTCMRSDITDTKRVSDELKALHMQMGAVEVLVHRALWLKEAE